MTHDLEWYNVQTRRIRAHREAGAEEEIRKLYKSLLNDLKSDLGKLYANNADDSGVIDFARLQRNSRYANFLELVEKRIDGISSKTRKEIKNTVQNTYKEAYEGLVDAVNKSKNMDELAEELKSIKSVTPETLKRAVQNPVSGLTLNDTLEKNRQNVIYDIKQVMNVGLVNGDHVSTIAKMLTEKVDIDYNKAVRICRTEIHRVQEAGHNGAAQEINDILEKSDNVDVFMVKIWHNMGDERVRPQQRRKTKKGWRTSYNKNGANHMKMEGQTVKANEKFDLGGGAKADCPGSSSVAAHDINCRCFVEYDLMTPEEFAKATGNKLDSSEKDFTNQKSSAIINIQLFAEKDISKQNSSSLHKGIKSYKNLIAEHKSKIQNPSKYVSDWDSYDDRRKQGLLRHWEKEINNFNQSIEDRINELKNRGE